MEFLSISEFLVEVSDDLFDYEEDVLENSFNILRMFTRLYGSSGAPATLAKCITEAEEKFNCLLEALDPELSLKYHIRCEEATREGGKKSGSPLGTWYIPVIIENEDLYRAEAAAHQNNHVSCTNEIKTNDLLVEDKTRMGSTPPSCHNKCNQCHPCMVVQVPTMPGRGRVQRHAGRAKTLEYFDSSPSSTNRYSNYKPLGWKCRCDDHLYNP